MTPKCNHEHASPNANFCPDCGTPLKDFGNCADCGCELTWDGKCENCKARFAYSEDYFWGDGAADSDSDFYGEYNERI